MKNMYMPAMAASCTVSTASASLPILRQRLASPLLRAVLPFGDARIDTHLSGGGLPLGRWHEIGATGPDTETGTVMAGFVACLLARIAPGLPVLWAASCCDLYPPGLLEYGFDPARLVLAGPRDDAETLAAMEMALREGGLAAVVGEVAELGRLPGRRLHLACLKQGVTGFVLRRLPYGRKPRRAAPREGTAAATRWRLSAAPAQSDIPREPGPPRWRAELLHAHGGRSGAWIMEKPDATHSLRVVAEFSDLPAEPDSSERRSRPSGLAAAARHAVR